MKKLLPLLLAITVCYSQFSIAKTINIVAGMNKPPYSYLKDGEAAGFEIELVTQVLATINITPEFVLIPYARSMRMLANDDVDAILTASPIVFNDKNVLTRPYISYQNVAVSLAKSDLEISEVGSLGRYSMAAFQMASRVLGKPFNTATKISPYYTELAEQKRQLEMLKQEKVQTLVMDINIFNYFKTLDYPDVDVAEVFPVSLYGLACKDPDLVKSFNRAWKKFRVSPEYSELKRKYNMQQVF